MYGDRSPQTKEKLKELPVMVQQRGKPPLSTGKCRGLPSGRSGPSIEADRTGKKCQKRGDHGGGQPICSPDKKKPKGKARRGGVRGEKQEETTHRNRSGGGVDVEGGNQVCHPQCRDQKKAPESPNTNLAWYRRKERRGRGAHGPELGGRLYEIKRKQKKKEKEIESIV